MKTTLTAERLRELLEYDPETGVFRWLVSLSNKGPAGSVAGSRDKHGYIQIGIAGRDYKAHRLAFLHMTGELPLEDVDHINGIPGDDRWVNLRAVSHAVNSQNQRKPRSTNKLGIVGVSPSGTRFKAQIMIAGKQHNLGRYKTSEEAHKVYLKAKRELHEGCTL